MDRRVVLAPGRLASSGVCDSMSRALCGFVRAPVDRIDMIFNVG
jgi:hypothetical protein